MWTHTPEPDHFLHVRCMWSLTARVKLAVVIKSDFLCANVFDGSMFQVESGDRTADNVGRGHQG